MDVRLTEFGQKALCLIIKDRRQEALNKLGWEDYKDLCMNNPQFVTAS